MGLMGLQKQNSWSPEIERDEAWERRCRGLMRWAPSSSSLSRTQSVTDNDLGELRGASIWASGWSRLRPMAAWRAARAGSMLVETLPALDLYHAGAGEERPCVGEPGRPPPPQSTTRLPPGADGIVEEDGRWDCSIGEQRWGNPRPPSSIRGHDRHMLDSAGAYFLARPNSLTTTSPAQLHWQHIAATRISSAASLSPSILVWCSSTVLCLDTEEGRSGREHDGTWMETVTQIFY